MNSNDLISKAKSYLEFLCNVKPNRRTGSAGNRRATEFFADTIRPFGYEIDSTPFDCLDYTSGETEVSCDGRHFEAFVSPYSPGCDVTAELLVVSTAEELENMEFEDKILLMTGEICSEQLMPKNFVFYNPEHHQRIIALLEKGRPAAIITATGKNPEQVGAIYPYPLFVDGDFDIPSAYCSDEEGQELCKHIGRKAHLRIESKRFKSSATNVVARLNPKAAGKIVVTAHIDAYESSPGASDNGSGTVVLLLLAEMLSPYRGVHCVEIAAFNGEDHYSAGGEMDYLNRFGNEIDRIKLVINIDDVGFKKGDASYSLYECPPQLEQNINAVLTSREGLVPGMQWFAGDHMIFVQQQIPALAITAENIEELMRTVTHTSLDTPDIIDSRKLVYLSKSLCELVFSL